MKPALQKLKAPFSGAVTHAPVRCDERCLVRSYLRVRGCCHDSWRLPLPLIPLSRPCLIFSATARWSKRPRPMVALRPPAFRGLQHILCSKLRNFGPFCGLVCDSTRRRSGRHWRPVELYRRSNLDLPTAETLLEAFVVRRTWSFPGIGSGEIKPRLDRAGCSHKARIARSAHRGCSSLLKCPLPSTIQCPQRPYNVPEIIVQPGDRPEPAWLRG